MTTLSLTEYKLTPGVHLSRSTRDALLGSIPGINVAPVAGERDLYDVTPSSWVGVAALPEITVEVRPKISIERLLFLIGYSVHRRDWMLQKASLDSSAGLMEAFVPIFCEVVRRAIQPDLLQGYRIEEQALQTVRGRIRFDDQIRDRFGLMPPVEVRHDEFTVDTPMNRLLKAAIDRLGRLPIRSPRARADLRTLAARFGPVARVSFVGRDLPELAYDRLTERYRPALQLAKLVLHATSPEMQTGAISSPALLVDMNQVFEDFVVTALREDLGLGERQFPQNCAGKRLRLDEGEKVRLRPDLSWWEKGRCVFVGDAKYKTLNAQGFKHGDLYQMLAYCVATDLPGGLLVYAAGESEPGHYRINHLGKLIEVVHLELSGDIDKMRDEIRWLAERVQAWRSRSRPAVM